MHHWIVSTIMLIGGAAVGGGIGFIIGLDVMRERLGKQVREERLKRVTQKHRFHV